MRDVDAATIAALQDPRGIVVVDLVTVYAKTLEGSDATLGFWSDVGDVTFVVRTPEGSEETRAFTGSGALLDVGDIALTTSLDVRVLPISFSQIHAATQAMARGHELRAAGVEVHRGLMSVDTRLPVAAAYMHFIGEVDTVDIDTPAFGGEGAITLQCVSDARQLTRANYARRGEAHSLARGGDRFLQYAGVVSTWEVWWGEKGAARPVSRSPSSGGGGSGGGFGGKWGDYDYA